MHAFAIASCGHMLKAYDHGDDWQILVLDRNRLKVAEWWASAYASSPDRCLRRAFESAAANSKLHLNAESIVIA